MESEFHSDRCWSLLNKIYNEEEKAQIRTKNQQAVMYLYSAATINMFQQHNPQQPSVWNQFFQDQGNDVFPVAPSSRGILM